MSGSRSSPKGDVYDVQQLLLSTPRLVQLVEQAKGISTDAQAAELSSQLDVLRDTQRRFASIAKQTSKDPRLRKLVRDFDKRIKPKLEAALKAGEAKLEEHQLSRNKAKLFSTSKDAPSRTRSRPQSIPSRGTANRQSSSNPFSEEKTVHGSGGLAFQQLMSSEAEQDLLREEEEALKHVHEQTQSLRELAQDVSQLVSEQQRDVDKIEDNSANATLKMVDGVNELAIAKKREARKHTTRGGVVSAVTGGVTGLLVGGPVGAVIGALGGAGIGATVGSGITHVSKRSIDAELRSMKALRAVQVHPTSGAVSCKFEVYELQVWATFSGRGWCANDPKWADGLGKRLKPGAPTPDKLDVGPKSALQFLFEDQVKKEEVEALTWQWGKGNWHIDLGRKGTDMHGWDYAYKFTHSGKWYPAMNRSTFVRRRLWVHYVVGLPKKKEDSKLATDAFSQKSNQLGARHAMKSEEALKHVHGAIQNMDEAETLTMANAEQIDAQGEQIRKGVKNSLIVSDTTEHADRIRRAADVSGVFMNLFTNPSKKSVKFTREQAKRDAQLHEKRMEHHEHSDDPLDVLAQKASSQYHVSNAINRELDEQNKQLDVLDNTTVKNQRKVAQLQKSLF